MFFNRSIDQTPVRSIDTTKIVVKDAGEILKDNLISSSDEDRIMKLLRSILDVLEEIRDNTKKASNQ